MDTTLSPPIPTNVKNDTATKSVQTALEIVDNTYAYGKVEQDSINYWIQQLFELGFSVQPFGRSNQKISSKVLQQCLWRVMSRTKMLDFAVHGSGASPEIEKIVTAGLQTVFDNGGLVQSFMAKDGAQYKLNLYGDGFVAVGADIDGEMPISFSTVSNTNLYVDSYATSIHNAGNGKNATKLAIIYSYSLAEAQKIYPNFKRKKAGVGRIPRDLSVWKDTERTYQQTTDIQEDLVEVCHYFDIVNDLYLVFAGQTCTILSEKKGDKYPFKLNGKNIIPVFQFLCIPSSEGFYNHGIGAMIMDLAIVTSRLLNMEVDHAEDNTYPITIYNVPQGEAAKIFNKLATAYEQRNAGYRATVGLEYDPNNPNAGVVSAQSLLTNNLTNEWQLIYNTLAQEIARLGIVLDDTDRSGNITATQIEAEEESQSAFVKQTQEYNAPEYKMMIEFAIQLIAATVPSSDKTPINLTTKIQLEEGGEMRVEDVTLGMVADELRKRKYFAWVNSRSGAVPSRVFEKTQISGLLPALPPGSRAQMKALKSLAELSGQDYSYEDLGGEGGQEVEQAPTDTDRLKPNPRTDAPILA